jgi:hypothetical protein
MISRGAKTSRVRTGDTGNRLIGTDVVERANARMVQGGDGLRFQLKALAVA